MFIYNKNEPEFNTVTITIASEIRNVIQNWRKENKLPISYNVPTLYVYYKEPIVKSAMVEGRCEAQFNSHLFEICQVDKVIYKEPDDDDVKSLVDGYDFICWSPLGGTIGKGNVLKETPCKIGSLNTSIKEAIEKHYYNEW